MPPPRLRGIPPEKQPCFPASSLSLLLTPTNPLTDPRNFSSLACQASLAPDTFGIILPESHQNIPEKNTKMNTKTNTTLKYASCLVASGLMAASANAAVTIVGEDTTTLSNWRTAATLEADSEYGTDGYVLYGIDSPDGTWNTPYDASSTATVAADSQVSMPSYITDIGLAANSTGRWSGNGNYGQIEDPGAGNALTSTPVLAWGSEPYTFTITRATSDAFRMTILVADGNGADMLWDTSVDAGAAGSATITGATTNGDGNSTYHVYDIDAGSDPITVLVTRSAGSGSPGNVTGFAFDAIPEPSAVMLLGLGGLAFLRRRR